MVTIFTPQLDPLVELPAGRVAAYCQEHSLVCKRTNTGDPIAYRADIEQIINSLGEREPVTIRQVRPGQPIDETVQQHLDHGRCVVVEPTDRAMRHFFTVNGFVLAMNEVAERVSAEILVPAGLYGKRYLFALQPPNSNRRCQEPFSQ